MNGGLIMGWIKGILKAAGVVIVATVAAPFVAPAAGVSLLTAKVGTGLLGSALAFGGSDEEDARREGYQLGLDHGIRKGSTEAARKFANIWELSDDEKAAALASAFFVAKIDGAINEDEIACIEGQLAAPDSEYHNDNLRIKFANVVNEVNDGLSFYIIKSRYLSALDQAKLVKLNNFVLRVIEADGGVTQKELDFFNNEWKPYLRSRGVRFEGDSEENNDQRQSIIGEQNRNKYTSNKCTSYSNKSSSAQYDFQKLIADGLNYNILWAGITHGDSEAEYKMGLAYDFGGFEHGIDKVEACKWYKKAASHGHESAKLRLNDILNQSNAYDDFLKFQAEGFNYSSLWRDVTHGDYEAAYKIGLAYDFDGFKSGIDRKEALRWYDSAASHGHEAAKLRLNELLILET